MGGGAVTISVKQPFTCDYDAQINISCDTNVTILGNGVILDTAQAGRCFTVSAGAVLILDSVTLRLGGVLFTMRDISLYTIQHL